jgi:hypothetical protein
MSPTRSTQSVGWTQSFTTRVSTSTPSASLPPEGHARTLAVNVLAPYVLTAEAERPARLIYISSDMHHGGDVSLHDIDWSSRQWRGVQAYSDSKLFVATLAFSVSRRLAQRKASYDFGRRGGPRGDARHALAAFVLELTDRRTCFCERFRCCRPASSVRFERV